MNLFIIIPLYILFIPICIIIHEFGHLIFALLTGYSFISIRLFCWIWLIEDEKLILVRIKNKGSLFSGQCLMSPPKDEKKFKIILYNLGGGLLNFIIVVVPFFYHEIFFDNYISRNLSIAMIVSNILICSLAFIPMRSPLPNDAMNLLTALKSKQAKHGFYLMLYTYGELAKGKQFRELDKEIFSNEEKVDYDNYFIAYTVIRESYRLYDIGEFDASLEEYKKLNLNKLGAGYIINLKFQSLYYYTVHNQDFEKAKEIYFSEEIQKCIKISDPSVKRISAAYEFFVNKDVEKSNIFIKSASEEIKKITNKGVRLMEKRYLSDLEKIMDTQVLE